jgi:hypothetical protein
MNDGKKSGMAAVGLLAAPALFFGGGSLLNCIITFFGG